jgi:ATP-binding cassette subfamily B protein
VLEDVSFTYPSASQPTLHGVELTLPAGATVALVGENGAGKTTLVKLLCGMYPPSAGRIAVDGVDLVELDPSAWRERTTATFQDFVRFQTTLADGVGAGDLPRIDEREAIAAALERAGAESHMDDAEAAWGELSVEASRVVDVLRRRTISSKGPCSCAS